MDDVLRRTRATELGVAPDSEAMAGFEPTAEDRVAALGEEAQALRGAGVAIFSATWEFEVAPDSMGELATRLQEVPNTVSGAFWCGDGADHDYVVAQQRLRLEWPHPHDPRLQTGNQLR